MKDFKEKACLCALNRIFGFEPKIALALISHLGSASEVFRLSSKEIDSLTGPYSRYRGLIVPKAMEDSAIELERLSKEGISFCGWTEDTYPDLLRECADAPIGLYVRSGTPAETLWKPARRIAIVGTRDISPYGRDWCEKTVIALSRCSEKPVIVSGLAIGTDICAHETALRCGLETIGVMATGPEKVYPWRHRQAAERIAATDGCALITDYPPGTAPLAIHFLRRNRIIAGLSEAVILIESKKKGGGMMTARLASSYNRDVYALPGRVDDLRSQGCNSLIREKTAEPYTSVEDLVDGLGFNSHPAQSKQDFEKMLEARYGPETDSLKTMKALLHTVSRRRGATLEEIAGITGISYTTILQTAAMLETDGYIRIDLMQRCTLENMKR